MTHADKLQVLGIDVAITYANEADKTVNQQEVEAYIARAHELHPGQTLNALTLEVDGDDVGISYDFQAVPFDRIRRITGYLVGTMDRWNDAKTNEEADRVKHAITN